MKYLLIILFLVSYFLSSGQGSAESKPILGYSKLGNTVPVESETSIDQFLNIIKFESGDTILTSPSLIKLK